MLDIKAIRKNPEFYKEALPHKGVEPGAVDRLLTLDTELRQLQTNTEVLKARQNEVSKEVPTLTGAKKEQVLADMKTLSQERKEKEAQLEKVKAEFDKILLSLPNPPHASVPVGGEDQFETLKEVGTKPTFDFKPKEHWELAEALGVLDTTRSAKISGARFYFLQGKLALLQRALIGWAFTHMANKGFLPMIPPALVRKESMEGTGFLTKADANEIYHVNPGEDDLYLIGTSEVPLTAYHSGEILDETDLPKKMVGHSNCFRREAGTYGKDTKGIFRVHQFEKVEMVIVCKPEDSWNIHEEMLQIEEEIMQALELPYRIVNIASGDLGNSAAKKYDIEAWLPGQNQYREMTSTSNCTDFQARRLGIRIRRADGTTEAAHTLNGTAVSSRPLVAILENNQQKDGTIHVPKILQPLCGFTVID